MATVNHWLSGSNATPTMQTSGIGTAGTRIFGSSGEVSVPTQYKLTIGGWNGIFTFPYQGDNASPSRLNQAITTTAQPTGAIVKFEFLDGADAGTVFTSNLSAPIGAGSGTIRLRYWCSYWGDDEEGYETHVQVSWGTGNSDANGDFQLQEGAEVPVIPATSVTLNKESSSILVERTEQLIAMVAPSDATNNTVTWTSSNTAVATVSSTGLVTAISAGTATITVTTVDGGLTDTCVVTVTPYEHESWTNATATGAVANKTAFSANDTVLQGQYVFGQNTDVSKLYGGASVAVGNSPLKHTNGGYAITVNDSAPSWHRLWISSWLAHDKRREFKCSIEAYTTQEFKDGTSTPFNGGLVLYPSETWYMHSIKFNSSAFILMKNGVLGFYEHGFTPTMPYTPRDLLGTWRKWTYHYYIRDGIAYVVASVEIDGVVYTSQEYQFGNPALYQHPIVAPTLWDNMSTGKVAAFRNLKVEIGALSAYSVDFGRFSGNEAIGTVRANGGGTWTYESVGGVPTYYNGNLRMYSPADGTARVVASGGSGTLELPTVEVPSTQKPVSFDVKSGAGITWQLKDAGGSTLKSGTTVEGIQTVDISDVTSPTIQLIFNMPGGTALNWADFSWTEPMQPVTNLLASDNGDGTVSLTWDDNTLTNIGYKVQRSLDGGAYVDLATLGDVETYTDTVEYTTVRYRVAPYNDIGVGDYSESNQLSKGAGINPILMTTF